MVCMTENTSKKLFWDNSYQKGRKYLQISENLLEKVLKIVHAQQTSTNTLKVLDVGCGRGGFLLRLFKKGFICFGIDISEEATASARELVPDATIICSDFEKNITFIEENQNNFDVITVMLSIAFIDNPETFFRTCKKLLNKKGLIVVHTPIWSKDFPTKRENISIEENTLVNAANEHFETINSINSEKRDFGLVKTFIIK